MIDIVAKKDIGNEPQERRLPDADPPNQKDGVWCVCLVLRRLDNPMLKKIYAAKNTVRASTSKAFLKLLNRTSAARASGIVDRVVGKDSGTGNTTTESVIVYGIEFCGKTCGLGSTSIVIDMARLL